MKIINIILTSQNGGAEQVFIDYSIVLRRLGHQVLCVIRDDAPYAEKLSALGIDFVKVKHLFGHHDIFVRRKLQKIYRTFGAQCVFAHAGRAMVISRNAAKKIKDRKIFHISVNHSKKVKRSIGSDFVISVNKEIFYKTVDSGQNFAQSFVVHNGIDVKDSSFNYVDKNLATKKEIVIGSVGSLDANKNFRALILAINHLNKNQNKRRFLLKIAGLGKELENLKNFAAQIGALQDVDFVGWIDDTKFFYETIDIFCLASKQETFGMVIIEAMKFCRVLISSTTDGAKEIIRNKIDGILIDHKPENSFAQRFAEAITEIVENPDLTRSMVESAFMRLKEKFSYEALEAKLKEIVGAVK